MDPDKIQVHRLENVIGYIAAAVLGIGIAAVLRTYLLTAGELGLDVFYHVRIADLGPGTFSSKQLPFLTMSTWGETFADKELLFHFILWALLGFLDALRISLDPPFHVPALFFTSLCVLSFLALCRSLRLRAPWLFALLLVSGSFIWTTRISMLRPHQLAVSLMLLTVLVLPRIRNLKHLWIAILCGAVWSWSYSTPHLSLIPVGVFSIFLAVEKRWRLAAALPVAVVVGLLLGYTLHPQFPNTFIIWKIQGIEVIRQNIAQTHSILIGNEARGLAGRDITIYWPIGLCLGLTVVALLLKHRIFREMEPGHRVILCLGVLFMIGLYVSHRFVEYAWPFSVLSLAVTWTHLNTHVRPPHRRSLLISLAIVILSVCILQVRYIQPQMQKTGYRHLSDFAAWAQRSNLPQNTVIGNVNWSAFPLLFYAAPQFRYLNGMDPMFGFFRYPEKTLKLDSFIHHPEGMMPPDRLAAIIDTQYAFVSYKGKPLALNLKRHGYVSIYEGVDGWLFDLGASNRYTP